MKFDKVTGFIPPNTPHPLFSILTIRGGQIKNKTSQWLNELLVEMMDYPKDRYESGVPNHLWLRTIERELEWRDKHEI